LYAFVSQTKTALRLLAAEKPAAILLQVEYYLSRDNLSGDPFLVSKMDAQGFVSLTTLAAFPKLKALTATEDEIIAAVANSDLVALSSDKTMIRPNVKVCIAPWY